MAQRKKSRRPGLLADRVMHSVETHAVVESGPSSGSLWGRRRVLLLNSTYEPLTALPMRRAVVMLLCGKADVVHDDPTGPVIHSATLHRGAVGHPAAHYVRVPYRARIPMTRAALMHRDRFRCAYCGGKADTVDHVIPRSRGGAHTWENCVASCSPCNHHKADKLLSELGWALRTARCRRRASTGGCCRRSRNSIRRGCDTWARVRRNCCSSRKRHRALVR